MKTGKSSYLNLPDIGLTLLKFKPPMYIFRVIPYIGFSHFTGYRGTPEIKTRHIYKAETPAHIFIKVFGYSGRYGDRKVMKT